MANKENIYEELNILTDEYEKIQNAQEKLLEERKEKILKIKEEYQKIITLNQNLLNYQENEIKKYTNLIEQLSTFKVSIIGNALAQVISAFENEEYIFGKVINRYRGAMTLNGNLPYMVDKTAVVIKKDLYQKIYESDTKVSKLKTLIKDNQGFIIAPIINNNFNIYRNYSLGKLTLNLDITGYNYCLDFINSLILYRMQNELNEFTEQNMIEFTQDYLELNQEKIKEYQSNKKRYLLKK